ncbi:hypothetical protein BCR32DRAFT_275672 [Anaeromyces robustus]|jgi:pimeloyl-ACP methyl ester carboxylesterase|uniref:AB hydrolase-1 domain-containing protein n=1 Tax=Anaeromyces robustus TaxID=1754192 RepID=A0A1Y1XK39_9FUNG|nr:hypothetical protein BCR32DRAFT_275672 [Anaeromyces robustus]|eukprot:ORX86127.1 hypothetical protein BCR32DRAFT_275672 [Anaeromyces robustus]
MENSVAMTDITEATDVKILLNHVDISDSSDILNGERSKNDINLDIATEITDTTEIGIPIDLQDSEISIEQDCATSVEECNNLVKKEIKDAFKKTNSEDTLKKINSKIDFEKTKNKEDIEININDNEMENENEKNTKNKKISIKNIIKFILKAILWIISLLLLVHIFYNIMCNIIENQKLDTYYYGREVDVNGHKMVIEITGENNEQTIVLLPGYSVPSPVLYYKPIAETFSKNYKVITIEPFGYGLSEMVEEERTVEQISSEIHTCLQQLKIDKYYLMGHFIGGIYSTYLMNKYPKEIIGFIGLDNTVPKFEEYDKSDPEILGKTSRNINILNILGISRLQSLIKPTNLYVPLTDTYKYSNDEKDMFRNFYIHKGFNKLVREEGYNLRKNLAVIHDMKFPKNITSIQFLSTSNNEKYPNYKQIHIDVGKESISNEVDVLKGDSDNFLFIHRDDILKKINDMTKSINE